jgi:hypothetical protein
LRSETPRYCLLFYADFPGDELQGDEDQAVSSSGWANDYAAVHVPGVNPCLCLALSGSELSATDNFGLHFWDSAIIFRAKASNRGLRLEQG